MSFDISSSFSSILGYLLNLVMFCYDLLDSIKLLGSVSVLDFLIALLLISAFLPIILSLVSSGYSSAKSGYKSRQREALRKKAKSKKGD